jgi:release factor glutamine methyltransferase
LPEHPKEKSLETTGGKKGYETITKFLKQAKSHLKKEGKILLIFSSLSKPRIIKEEAKKYYTAKEKSRKKLFFEELFVWELERS